MVFLKKLFRYILLFLLFVIALFLVVWTAIQFPSVQNGLIHKVTKELSKTLDTKVSIGKVDIDFFKTVSLEGIYIEDKQQDTLLYAKELKVDIGFFSLFQQAIYLDDVSLEKAKLRLSRSKVDSVFNYNFILDAFASSPDTEQDTNAANWKFSLNDVSLKEVDFHFDDQYAGMNINTLLDDLRIELNELDLSNQLLDLDVVRLANTEVDIYLGEASPDYTPLEKEQDTKIKGSQTIPFPYTGWDIKLATLQFSDTKFHFNDMGAVASSSSFNDQDIDLDIHSLKCGDFNWGSSDISIEIMEIKLEEQSGFTVDDFKTQLTLTEQRAVIESLYFETPYSKFKNTTHLEMNVYSDLIQKFDRTRFSTKFNDSYIGSRDLYFFRKFIGDVPFINLSNNKSIYLDGQASGTFKALDVNSLKAEIPNVISLHVDGKIMDMTDPEALQANLEIHKLNTSYLKVSNLLEGLSLPEGLSNFGDFNISGLIKGKLNSLRLSDFKLNTEASTGFELSGDINHLVNKKEPFFDLKIEQLYTKADDLKGFIKNPLPSMLDTLGHIKYEGKFKGTTRDFELVGRLDTALGALDSDIAMVFDQDYASAEYDGNFELQDFLLGRLLGDSLQLDRVSLRANVKGQGFSISTLDANMDVRVESLDYAEYEYKDIMINGTLNRGVFNGALSIKDENVSLDFEGTASFNEQNPIYNFDMQLDTLNLAALNMTGENLSISATMDMNFKGRKINDFEGRAHLANISISNGERYFHEDSLTLAAVLKASGQRQLSLSSSFLGGTIEGDYDLEELPTLITAYLNEYFPLEKLVGNKKSYVDFQEIDKPQQFELEFRLMNAKPIALFSPQLEYLETAVLSGKFDSMEKELDLKMNIEKLLINDMKVEAVNLSLVGDAKSLRNSLSVRDFAVNDKVNIPSILLRADMLNDSMYTSLKVKNDTIANLLDLKAVVYDTPESYRLELDRDLTVNDNKWEIDEANQLSFKKNALHIDQLTISQEAQSLQIQSIADIGESKMSPIQIVFNDFQINDITKLASLENVNLNGIVNGKVVVKDPLENLHYTAVIKIPNLILNEEPVGELAIDIAQENQSQIIDINIGLQGRNNDIKALGEYNISSGAVALKVDIPKLEMRLIDPFLPGLISKSKGTINAVVDIGGSTQKPLIDGTIQLDRASTKIDFTQARYTVREGMVKLNNQTIDLGSMVLEDTRGDEAVVSGRIKHDFFDKLTLDIRLRTNRFTFLNTESKDNELFYGKLFLKATATVKGPVDLPKIEVYATTLENAELNVSAFGGEERFTEEKYIIFGNPNTLRQDTVSQDLNLYEVESSLAAEVNLNLELSEKAIFRVIVDPVTGDLLECRGTSDMIVNLKPSGTIDMFGTYVVDSGKYRFSYTDLVKRDFELVKGSTVTFNGDPLDARFDVTAKYSTEATPYDLVGSQTTLSDQEIAFAQRRQQVDVLLGIAGNIAEPRMKFNLEFPESETSVINSEIQRKLVELRNNQTEMNKQVFGLILFNGFISSGRSTNISDAGESIVYGSMSRFVSKQLNQLADKYISGVEVNFDLNSYKSQYANQGSGATITELGVGVTKQFSDRLSLQAGGNVEVNSTSNTTGFSQVAGNFVLNYKLSPTGPYILKVFRKSDFDVLNEENSVKTGVGISVSKSFGKQ